MTDQTFNPIWYWLISISIKIYIDGCTTRWWNAIPDYMMTSLPLMMSVKFYLKPVSEKYILHCKSLLSKAPDRHSKFLPKLCILWLKTERYLFEDKFSRYSSSKNYLQSTLYIMITTKIHINIFLYFSTYTEAKTVDTWCDWYHMSHYICRRVM